MSTESLHRNQFMPLASAKVSLAGGAAALEQSGRSPGDEPAGEVEHCQVGPLLPADKEPAEAVEPGLCALDYPSAGAETGFVRDRPRLLAARPDMGGETELGEERV